MKHHDLDNALAEAGHAGVHPQPVGPEREEYIVRSITVALPRVSVTLDESLESTKRFDRLARSAEPFDALPRLAAGF